MKEIKGKIPFKAVGIPKNDNQYELTNDIINDVTLKCWDKNDKFITEETYFVYDSKNEYSILGKFSELSEKDCARLVKKIYTNKGKTIYSYKDYVRYGKIVKEPGREYYIIGFDSAKNSLHSLLNTHGLYYKDWVTPPYDVQTDRGFYDEEMIKNSSEDFLIILKK